LGASKVFCCPKCPWRADRDCNSTTNVLQFHLLKQKFRLGSNPGEKETRTIGSLSDQSSTTIE
jgi:transposase